MSKAATKKSALARQAEKLFSQQSPAVSAPLENYPVYSGELRVVQTVTTYSACEEPIPNPYKQQ